MIPSDSVPVIGCVDGVPYCRRMDIFLRMDDHDIHIIDQNALDLRHDHPVRSATVEWIDVVSPYVDNDKYAFVALHSMCFISNFPYVPLNIVRMLT